MGITTTSSARNVATVDQLDDGSESNPSIAFQNEQTTGLFRPASNTIAFTVNGTERFRATDNGTIFNEQGNDYNIKIEGSTEPNLFFTDAGNDRIGIGTNTPSTELDVAGGSISGIGGTTDASTGAIRLSSGSQINYRNNADDGDIGLVTTNASDDFRFGFDGNHRNVVFVSGTGGAFNIGGMALVRVGGTTDASAGAIRLANDTRIMARNNADDGDIRLITTNTSDDVVINEGNLGRFVTFGGSFLRQIGGTTDASAGAIRMANNVEINWRSSEDDNDHGWRLTAAEAMTYKAAGSDVAEITEGGNLNIEGTLTESTTV